MTTPPDSLPDDAMALKELLIAARDENERLIAIIKVLQRHRFGPRSEQIDPDQLALMLEDVEQAIAAAEAEAEGKREPAGTPVRRKRQINRGALPKHLPREEVVVDLADKCCLCCNRLRVKLGEDVSERLDMIPARFKVIVTRRPKYACRECDGEVAQAPAPEHLIEGGIPTEALIAAVVIASGPFAALSCGCMNSPLVWPTVADTLPCARTARHERFEPRPRRGVRACRAEMPRRAAIREG